MAVAEAQKSVYEQFLSLPEGTPCQLIGGELIMAPSPTAKHQLTLWRLGTVLSNFILSQKAGLLFYAPMDVFFGKNDIYQPDLLFIAENRREIVKENRIEGAPDLVIEILSASTAYYDLRHKWKVYEKHNVKEYWIVDPIENSIDVHENIDGKFQRFASATASGTVSSKLLVGLSVDLGAVFQKV